VTKRPARAGQVNDATARPDLRSQLARTMQLHDLDRLPMRFEPCGRGARVLRRDSDHRRPGLGPVEARAVRHGEHKLAPAEAEVDQLVVRAWCLPTYVLAADAQVRSAV